MTPPPSQPSSQKSDDDHWRRQIGPWKEDDLLPLDDFEPNTNFVVRAAAGSGKTTALVARIVGLIRKGEAKIQDLAAITFTRKAASEMQERLYEELLSAQAVLEGEKGSYNGTEAQKKRVDEALKRVQQCFVGTVHSFCGRLLREHALEAELPPDFAVGIDERDQAELRSQVWERYIGEAHRKDKSVLDELEAVGLQPRDLTGLFKTVSAYPELDLYTAPPDTLPDFDAGVRRAKEFVDRWQSHRPDVPPDDRGSVQRALDKAEGLIENHGLHTRAQKAQLLEILEDGYKKSDKEGNLTLKAWGDNGSEEHAAAKTLKDDAYQEFADAILPVLRDWRAYVHDRVIDFVRPAAKAYRETRREEGLLTHHDVLYHTRNLLRDNPEVRETAYQRTPRLLVDEFQDTDPLQAEILFYLTAKDSTTKHWTECVPKPGSLFIVGDDKQSIYRFRRADLTVFNEVVDQLTETGGEEATLTTNFRSYDKICSFCDDVFKEAFAEAEREETQAKYTPFATPDDAGGRDEHGVRRLKVGYKSRNDAGEIAEDAAEQIAGFIQHALYEGKSHEMAGPPEENPIFEKAACPEDFIILTGGKKHLSTYGEALARAGIPFTITGSNDLGDSDDLKDFVDLLTCALRPRDELAVLSYLQGGLCGFSDDDLYRLRTAFDAVSGNPFQFVGPDLPEAALNEVEEPLAQRFARAFIRVQRAREEVQSKRPGLALPSIAENAGLLAAAAHAPSGESGSFRAGRLLRAFSLVQEKADEGDDWAEILSILQDVLDGEVEADGLTLESGSGNAVQVMNLHQVKGLEAPVVFLADPYPETGKNHSPTQHIKRQSGSSGTLVAPITKETPGRDVVTHPPLGWEGEEGFEAIEEEYQNAEKKRLVYVAATRAERLLVVSEYHHKKQGRKEGDWADLYRNIDNFPVLNPNSPNPSDTTCPAPDLDSYRDQRDAAIERAQRPSYTVEQASATEDGRDSSLTEETTRTGERDGRVLGLAVHALLERIVRRGFPESGISTAKVRTVLQNANEQVETSSTTSGVSDAFVETARTMVERFVAGSLAARVRDADRAFVEYPVSEVRRENSDTIRRGIIDLVYKDSEGWHIVDYKTDRVESGPPDVPGDHKYRVQVRQYAEAWERIAGSEVASASLWFADVDETIDVQ